MKHIGIDCRFAGIHCGLGRYTSELVHHLLLRDDNVDYTLFVRNEDEKWLQNLPKTPKVLSADVKHYSIAEQMQFSNIIKTSNIELLFSPHFNVPLRCPVPFIVTIHDMILHRFPNEASFFKQCAYKVIVNHAVRRSQSIITVSNFVEKELTEIYGQCITKKTTTVYEGVSNSFVPASERDIEKVLSQYNIAKNFILYVGNAKQHKNVQMLLDAYKRANPKHSLVLISGGKELFALDMPSGVQVLSDVLDEDLSLLYSASSAFVTASQYEGFGLPIAESQACGTPVIAVHCSAIPEIADKNAVLVRSSVSSLAEAMRNVDSMEPPSKNMFSWSDTARGVSQILC